MTDDLEAGPVCAAATCTRPAAPVLCLPDTRRLGDWLAQLGTEYELLSAAPSMQAREPGTIGGGTLASQRSVGRENVMVLRDPRSKERSSDDPDGNDERGVFETLHAYAETVREARDITRPVRHVPACRFPCMHRACLLGVGHAVPVPLTVASERALLVEKNNFRWLLMQESAGEFFDDVRRLYGQLRHANGHAAPAQRISRLHTACPACGVRAVTHRHGDDLMECQSCHDTRPYEGDNERLSA